MNANPALSQAAHRRESIAGAAIDVFAAAGYGGASLRELANAAGLEKGHLTYYFRTKEELLFEVIAGFHRRFIDGLTIWGSHSDSPAERLRDVMREHIHLVSIERASATVAYESMRFLTPPRRSAVTHMRRSYEVGLAELIDAARSEVAIAPIPTRFLTKAMLAIANWPYQWYSPDGDLSADDVARMFADRALASVLDTKTPRARAWRRSNLRRAD